MLSLCVLLAAAVWHDVRARRIPNALVFPGMLAALALHAALPAAQGGLGIVSACGGLVLGLAILLPMYALRMMGAGDVKLLAMVGAFVGAGQIAAVALATLIAGGVLALAVAAAQGSLRRLLGNTRQMMIHTGLSALAGFMAPPVVPAAPASGRLPYAVAIAAGTAACIAWQRIHGAWPL
jgi:prepilin peptidase CpaA